MSAPTLATWLQTHPFDSPDTTVPPDVVAAYHLNAGENVLADIAITDVDHNPIPAVDVKVVTISVRRNEVVVLEWSWIADGVMSDQIDVENGHIFLEISKENTQLLAGLYDFEVQLSVASDNFFFSSAQTDIQEARATLFIRAVIVNPVSS